MPQQVCRKGDWLRHTEDMSKPANVKICFKCYGTRTAHSAFHPEGSAKDAACVATRRSQHGTRTATRPPHEPAPTNRKRPPPTPRRPAPAPRSEARRASAPRDSFAEADRPVAENAGGREQAGLFRMYPSRALKSERAKLEHNKKNPQESQERQQCGHPATAAVSLAPAAHVFDVTAFATHATLIAAAAFTGTRTCHANERSFRNSAKLPA